MPWNERIFCHKYFWMLYLHFLVLESNLSPLNTKMLNFMSCLLNAFFYDWPHLLTPRVYVWVSSSMFIWSLEGILLLSRVSAAHWALGLWVSRKWVVAGTGTTPTSCSIPHHTYADAALLLHQTPPISCSYHIKSFPQAVPCLSRRFSVHRPVCDDRCVAATKTIACSNCRLLDKYSRFKLVLPFSCFSLHVFVCISPFCCEPRSGSLHNWSL